MPVRASVVKYGVPNLIFGIKGVQSAVQTKQIRTITQIFRLLVRDMIVVGVLGQKGMRRRIRD
jgi:hypothetical protein